MEYKGLCGLDLLNQQVDEKMRDMATDSATAAAAGDVGWTLPDVIYDYQHPVEEVFYFMGEGGEKGKGAES